MANTDIKLINDGGTYVPSVASVPVVKGDTVTFTTSDGGSASLFFSPAAAAVLSPQPTNPVSISRATKIALAFTSSAAGAYSVFVGTDANQPPQNYPSAVTGQLLVEIGGINAPPFGINDNMSTGH